MRKKILGLIVLLTVALVSVMCASPQPPSSNSNEASPQTSQATEQPSVIASTPSPQTTSSSTPDEASPSSSGKQPETIQSNSSGTLESNGSSGECPLKLSSLIPTQNGSYGNPEVDCTVAFDVKGEVYYERKDFKKQLSAKPEVIKGSSTLTAKGDSKADLLFDTLDWVKLDKEFKFSPDLTREDVADEPGITSQGNYKLDLGEILVANVRPKKPGSETATSVSLDYVASKPEKASSLWAFRLWDWGIHQLQLIAHAATQFSWFNQKALAEQSNLTKLGIPSFVLRTPEVTVESNLAVYVVKRDADRKRTQVFSLSDEPIRITDKVGKSVELRRNQTSIATQTGLFDNAYEFKLCRFYKDHPGLLAGLAPGEEELITQKPLPLQMSYHAARSITLLTYNRNCQRRCPQTGS